MYESLIKKIAAVSRVVIQQLKLNEAWGQDKCKENNTKKYIECIKHMDKSKQYKKCGSIKA